MESLRASNKATQIADVSVLQIFEIIDAVGTKMAFSSMTVLVVFPVGDAQSHLPPCFRSSERNHLRDAAVQCASRAYPYCNTPWRLQQLH